MKVDLTIQLAHCDEDARIPTIEDFQSWTDLATHDREGKSTLCIRIVDKSESQELNRHFRKKDSPTNILSFEYELPPEVSSDNQTLGDLVLCPAIIAAEAAEYGVPLQDHWAHLIIHGVLHLIGYDHIDDADAQVMQKKEIELLSKLNIKNPYS